MIDPGTPPTSARELSPVSSVRREVRREDDAAQIASARRLFEEELQVVRGPEGTGDVESFVAHLMDGSYLRDVAVAVARARGAALGPKLYALDGANAHFENLT
jgi:hypothetical protein